MTFFCTNDILFKCGIVTDIFAIYLFKSAAKANHSFRAMEWEYSKKIT